MAFPDDYRRWQVAGGNAAVVDSQVGLLRQLMVDTSNLNIRLMDGVTPGGHKVVMDKDFAGTLESKAPVGELAYVQDPDANDPNPVDGQAPKRMWTSRVFRDVMLMLADMSNPLAWIVKDAAMPETVRASAKLITNLDEAVVSGWYRFVPNATTGLPGDLPSASTDQYMMLVIRQSSAELSQLIIGREATGKIWTRSRVAGNYQAWTLATGVTSADLLNYVARAGSTMTGKLTLATPSNVLAQLRMLSGVSPSAPNDGDIWRDDAAGGLRLRKGGVTVKILDDSNLPLRNARALLSRDSPGGSASPSITAGAWSTLAINTEVTDPQSIVELASNVFTPNFDCWVEWTVPFYRTNNGASRLYNVTDGVVVRDGSVSYSDDTNGRAVSVSIGYALCVAGKSYRLEGRVALTGSVGISNPYAEATSVHTQVYLERI